MYICRDQTFSLILIYFAAVSVSICARLESKYKAMLLMSVVKAEKYDRKQKKNVVNYISVVATGKK